MCTEQAEGIRPAVVMAGQASLASPGACPCNAASAGAELESASPADERPVGTPAQSWTPIAPLLQSLRRAHSEPSRFPAMDATDVPLQAEMVELVPNGKHTAALTASAVPSLAGDR